MKKKMVIGGNGTRKIGDRSGNKEAMRGVPERGTKITYVPITGKVIVFIKIKNMSKSDDGMSLENVFLIKKGKQVNLSRLKKWQTDVMQDYVNVSQDHRRDVPKKSYSPHESFDNFNKSCLLVSKLNQHCVV